MSNSANWYVILNPHLDNESIPVFSLEEAARVINYRQVVKWDLLNHAGHFADQRFVKGVQDILERNRPVIEQVGA